ncbi:hypothetical protein ACFL6L_03385 [candidate division KSB1 bacterium]
MEHFIEKVVSIAGIISNIVTLAIFYLFYLNNFRKYYSPAKIRKVHSRRS